MSYTMTLDVPEKTAEYVERSPRLRRDLNAIFIAVATTRMNTADEESMTIPERTTGRGISCAQRLDSFVRGLPKLTGEPYRFRRSDAYDEELA